MFFKSFSKTEYDFYNTGQMTQIPDIFKYVKTIDKRFDSATPYQFYEIGEERPDQVSNKLYSDPSYHWTFFLINDSLKGGIDAWPMTYQELNDYVDLKYPNYTITAYRNAENNFNYNSIHNKFPVGTVLTGADSGAKAKVIARNAQLNQLVIEYTTETKFTDEENITSTAGNIIYPNREIRAYKNSVKYYLDEDDNKIPNADNLPLTKFVTYYQAEELANDSRRFIRVLKSSYVRDFTVAYRKLVSK